MTAYSDLRAVYINCTLKRSPDVSHTQGLADRSIAIMEANAYRRAVPARSTPADADLAGEKSSVCTQVIERLYGNSHLLNENGQYAYYGRTAGCLVTGNEDGVKHCA